MTNPYFDGSQPGGPQAGGPGAWQQPQQPYPQPSPYAQPAAYPQPGQYAQQPQQFGQYPQAALYPQHFPNDQPQFHPEPKKRSKAWIYISIVAVLVVAGAGTFALIRSGKDESASPAASNSTSAPVSKSTPQPPPAPGHSKPGPNTPPGWQSVGSPSGFAYDVPGDWAIQKPTMVLYWEKPCPDGPMGFCSIRSLVNAATRAHPPQDGCKDTSTSAIAGFLSPKQTEIPAADRQTISDALEAEAKIVPAIYTDWGTDLSVPPPPAPPISRSDVRQFKIGDAPALQESFTVTGINTSLNCNPPSSVYTVVATTNPKGAVVTLAIQLDQGYPQSPDPAIAQKIIDTIRPEGK